jgi:hypothetical protein
MVGCSSCDAFAPEPPVELDSVADAPRHHEAKRLSFQGGPRPDLVGETSWMAQTTNGRSRGPRREMWMHVVPVVPSGWNPEHPVPLWVTSSDNGEQVGDWMKQLARLDREKVVGKVVDYAGREPGFRTESGWQRAIQDAESKHGIESDPHAPVVMWPEP